MRLFLVSLAFYILLFSSCHHGIDFAKLITPDGVVIAKSAANKHKFSLFSSALYQTINGPAQKSETEEENSLVLKSLASLEKTHIATADIVNFDEIQQIFTETDADMLALPQAIRRIEKISYMLTKGPVRDLLKNTESFPKEVQVISSQTEQHLRTRLWQEVLRVRAFILKIFSETANKSLGHTIVAFQSTIAESETRLAIDRLRNLLEFLKTAPECMDLDVSLIFWYHEAAIAARKIVANLKDASLDHQIYPGDFAHAHESLEKLFSDSEIQQAIEDLFTIQKAATILSSSADPTAQDEMIELLPFGGVDTSSKAQFPVQILSDRISRGARKFSVEISLQEDAQLYAEYFALEGRQAFIFDLLPLQKQAHALHLSAEDFVDWAAKIIDGLAKSQRLSYVVIANLPALFYDPSLTDAHLAKKAMAANYERLLSRVNKVVLIAPITVDHHFLFGESEAAIKTHVAIDPLNLKLAENFLKNIVLEKMQSYPYVSSDFIPHLAMAKIYRALKPDSFHVETLIANSRLLFEQLSVREEISIKEQQDLALKIVENQLMTTIKDMEKNRILRHSSLAIEDKLLVNKTIFSEWSSHRAKDAKNALEIQLMIANLFATKS